jgi:hypothetical protein
MHHFSKYYIHQSQYKLQPGDIELHATEKILLSKLYKLEEGQLNVLQTVFKTRVELLVVCWFLLYFVVTDKGIRRVEEEKPLK